MFRPDPIGFAWELSLLKVAVTMVTSEKAKLNWAEEPHWWLRSTHYITYHICASRCTRSTIPPHRRLWSSSERTIGFRYICDGTQQDKNSTNISNVILTLTFLTRHVLLSEAIWTKGYSGKIDAHLNGYSRSSGNKLRLTDTQDLVGIN